MEHAEKLLHENTGLVYFVLRRYFHGLIGDQDIVQEGFIGLWMACLKYDGRVKFSTFAVPCIKNTMLAYLRKQRRVPRALSLDAPLGNDDSYTSGSIGSLLEDAKASAFETDIFANDFMQRLSIQDSAFVALLIEGLTQQNVGKATGIPQVVVSRRLKKIKNLYQKIEARGVYHAE